jgi:pSer/pThr/pTyr-binding forkhead associated (FHA) protein
VSRRHAHLAWSASQFTITDLGSTNGTFLDGRRIDPHRPETAHPGQRVRLAAHVEFELIGGPTCS